MADASLQIGNGNWAVKPTFLLGYNVTENGYNPVEMAVSRATTATRTNELGIIETKASDIARINYEGGVGSLLLEPQRTNLVTYSEDFSNASWIKSSVTILSGFLAPNGLNNAYKITDISGGTMVKNITPNNVSGNIKSIYVKSATINGTVGILSHSSTGVRSITTEWQRLDRLINIPETGSENFYAIDFRIGTIKEILIWGAQLEQGAYPTSYIPTIASTVTRNADVISKTGISGLIGQTEGVIYFENIVNFKNVTSAVTLQRLSNSIDTDFINLYVVNSSDIYMDLSVAGVYVTTASLGNISSLNLGDTYKIAIQYNSFGVKTYKNGVFIQTSNSFIFNNFSNLFINYSSSYINNKSTILFKNYLTDAECIALTTL